MDLLDRIRHAADRSGPLLLKDVDAVRGALSMSSSTRHPAMLKDSPRVIAALTRIIDGTRRCYEAFDSTVSLQSSFDDPDAFIAAVLEMEPKEHLNGKNGYIKPYEIYSLAVLLLALRSVQGIPMRDRPYPAKKTDRRTVDFDGSNAGLFARSRILQAIEPDLFGSPEGLIAKLVEIREDVEAEQAPLRDPRFKNFKGYSISTLMQALNKGRSELFGKKANFYTRLASARDLYERSQMLRSVPEESLEVADALMGYLIARRDRITLEDAAARRLPARIEDASQLVSLKNCVEALRSSRRIGVKMAEHLNNVHTSPLENFLKRREVLEPEVRRVMELGAKHDVLKFVDRTKFVSLKGTRMLGDEQTRRIIRSARQFLSGGSPVTKSIYGAQELAMLARAPHFIPSRPGLLPDDFARDLDEAAGDARGAPYRARRQAVIVLGGLKEMYSDRIGEDSEVGRYARGIARLYDWNSDAVSVDAPFKVPKAFITSTMTFVPVAGMASRI